MTPSEWASPIGLVRKGGWANAELGDKLPAGDPVARHAGESAGNPASEIFEVRFARMFPAAILSLLPKPNLKWIAFNYDGSVCHDLIPR